MPSNKPTRCDDEALLAMLRLRRTKTAVQIGRIFGKTDGAVRVATNYVVNQDGKTEGRDLRRDYGFLDQRRTSLIGRGL